jgi:hypothetical protein
MRKLLKLLMMSMLVVGVVSAIASSTASAANCVEKAEEKFRVCLFLSATELELLESATFSLLQEETSPHKLEVKTSTPTDLECSEGSGTAGVFVETVEGATITFKGCKVTSANKAECEVPGEIIGSGINASFSLQTELEGEVEGLRLDLLLKSETTGGTFATFSITSVSGKTCAEAIENGKVKGEQLCFFLEPIETDEVEHLLECPATGSELTFGGNPLSYEAEDSLLMSTPVAGNSWSIVQGE